MRVHDWETAWVRETFEGIPNGRYRAGFKCRACGKESRTESRRMTCERGPVEVIPPTEEAIKRSQGLMPSA